MENLSREKVPKSPVLPSSIEKSVLRWISWVTRLRVVRFFGDHPFSLSNLPSACTATTGLDECRLRSGFIVRSASRFPLFWSQHRPEGQEPFDLREIGGQSRVREASRAFP